MKPKKAWKKSKPRRRRRSLMSSNIGPWLVLLGIIVGVAALIFVGYRFAFPAVMNFVGMEWPPRTPAPPTPTPKPTPSPNPVALIELTKLQEELSLHNEAKFGADPMRFGDQIVYVGGKDEGGPRFHTIYQFDIETKLSKPLSDITKTNDDFFQPQLGENFLVWLDHKRTGGGLIRAKNLKTKEIFTVKEYYDGMPRIALSGNRVCWTERTGSKMDKVFLFELETKENICLEMMADSEFGKSDVHMRGNEIVWAGYDMTKPNISHETEPEPTTEDAVASNTDTEDRQKAAIFSIDLSQEMPTTTSFNAGGYVHDPMTNGKDRVWIDANHGPKAKLMLSLDGKAPIMIDEGITGYGIGSNFVAYCKEEKMFVYSWGDPPFSRMISLGGERCIFSGVSDDTVFWYVTGVEGVPGDIIKFAALNGNLIATSTVTPANTIETAAPTSTTNT